MLFSRLHSWKKVLLVACIFSWGFVSCEKEYSYEGGEVFVPPDTNTDSSAEPGPPILPVCNLCGIDPTTDSTFWNLQFQGQEMCGGVTRAIITVDRTGFTFFGPSKCSRDTGLVMSVALHLDTLNRDKTNLFSNNVALEYYDNTTQTNFFESMRQSINFTIIKYDHSTQTAEGKFSGKVKLKDGSVEALLNGSFVFHFDR